MHGLVGELGVGTVTHSTLQMGLALAGVLAGLGLTFMATGGGLVWAQKAKDPEVSDANEVPEVLTVPDEFFEDTKVDATIS